MFNALNYAILKTQLQQIASVGGQDLVDAAVAARDDAVAAKNTAAAYAAQLAAGTASPAGTYANLTALTSANPDHGKIYITLDDGKWCYHNGTAWVAGGQFQATERPLDTTLSVSGMAADAKVTGDKVGELKSAFANITGNNPINVTQGGYIKLSDTSANISSPVSTPGAEYAVSECGFGDVFTVSALGGGDSRAYGFTDQNGLILSVAPSSTTLDNETLIAPQNAAYIIVNNLVSNGHMFICRGESVVKKANRAEDEIENITGVSRITGWENYKYLTTDGSTVNINSPTPSSAYRYAVIECNEYDRFTISGKGGTSPRLWAFVDDQYGILTVSAANAEERNTLIIAPGNAAYLIINDQNKNKDSYVGEFINVRINEITHTEYVTPEMFHDGISTDWTSAVQSAIDYAHDHGGLCVLFSAKAYYISQIELKTRVHLMGVSAVGSVLYANSNVDKMIVIPTTTAYCGIHNLQIHGVSNTNYGIYVTDRSSMSDQEKHLVDFEDFTTEVSQNIVMVGNVIISGTQTCALFIGTGNARGIYNNIDIINANGDGISLQTVDSTMSNISIQAYRTPLKLSGSNNKLSNIKIWFGCSTVSAGNDAKCGMYISGNRNVLTNIDIQDICGNGITFGQTSKNNILSNILLDSIGASDSDYNVSAGLYSCIVLKSPSVTISSCRISNFRGDANPMPKKILVDGDGNLATFTDETFIEIIAKPGSSIDSQSISEYTHNPL